MKGSLKTNPNKRWECDACFSIYKDYFLNKNGGFCPECGCDSFSEVDHGEAIWKTKERDISLDKNRKIKRIMSIRPRR